MKESVKQSNASPCSKQGFESHFQSGDVKLFSITFLLWNSFKKLILKQARKCWKI